MTRPILFSDRGCPFAHRVLALVHHLGLDLDHRQSVLGTKPAGLERYASSKPIPLLVDGPLVLTESRVMLEHLAEREAWTDAWPASLPERTLHRQAMAIADAWIGAVLTGRAPLDPDSQRTADRLDALEAATRLGPPRPSLLALHLAPMWFHASRLRADLALGALLRTRPALADWLEQALALPCVQATTGDVAVIRADVERALSAGPIDLTGVRTAS